MNFQRSLKHQDLNIIMEAIKELQSEEVKGEVH